jgi:hypothetical protein
MRFPVSNIVVDTQKDRKNVAFVFPFLFLFFLLFAMPKTGQSQSFNPLISFSVSSCTLDVALEKLFAEYELNVAFSKAELSKIRIEKYSCTYKSVEEVLTDLLKGTGYGFKKIGKQYVIRKNQLLEPEEQPITQKPPTETPPQEPSQEIVEHKIDSVWDKPLNTVRVFDTLQVIRTVMRYDTIVRVEQVFKTDTVYKVKYRGFEIHWPDFKDNGWFISPSLAYGFPHLDYEDKLQAENGAIDVSPISAFNVSLDGGYKWNRLSFGMSLSYRSMKYRFMLNQVVYDGDCYVNDTLDSYYVVHPFLGDTSYYYIMDSTYVPLVTTNYSYRDVNQLDYLSVGAFAAFDFWKREHFRMFIKAGVSADVLLSCSGSYNSVEQPFHAALSRADAEPVRLSYYGGFGAAFKIVNRLELVPEAHFRKTNGSLYRADFPFDLRMWQWDVRLGLTYYF